MYLCWFCINLFFFFFQAEDGIRDRNVTGVQTCALPIYPLLIWAAQKHAATFEMYHGDALAMLDPGFNVAGYAEYPQARSEERRVGKECRSRRAAEHEKKKEERKTKREKEYNMYNI